MDLPFLHYPNFKEPLQHSDSTSQPLDSDPTQRQLLRLPDAPQELLFAFLALTARFHNSLINHHIQANTALPDKVPPAIAVAEMYARAARTQLYSYSNGTVALKQTQTLLMLAVHDWSIGRGRQAFAYDLGTAVRALQFDQLDCMDKVTSAEVQRAEGSEYTKMVNGQKQTPKSLRERVIDEESQRRTVWSGYIVDRYFGCRKHPPSMLNVQDMALQLPSSDEAFTFGQRKVTRMLNETDESFENRLEIALQQEIRVTRDDSNRDYDHDHEMDDLDSEDLSEIGSKEGILSRWIKAVTMLGAVTEWSCAGGRRSGSKKEQAIPPWDPSSKFSRLTGDLSAFENSLPRNLKYSKSNTNAHHSSGGKASTTPYIMINVVRFLCTILLHREYLPFVALDSPKPEGPTKAPLLNPRNPPNDSKYWEASARRCFEAARKLVDLLSECQERKILPETPLVALAIYIAGFCGVYSRAFPHMDPDRLMYLGLAREKVREEPVAKAYALILQMCPRMIMAFPYIDRLPNAIDYYEKRQHHHGAHHSKDNSTEGEVGNGEETTEWTGLDGTSTFTRDHMADASLPDPVVLQQLLANFLEKVLPPEQREVSGALHPYPARSDSTRPPGLTSFTPVNNPASPPATPSVKG
ncbi:hypothetical protein EJ04DRAFT_194815 [Polyplosphaeria fusca]|uniref:Xylanolytic transcriptional activator regulatory domain-containing protein n=1 Tax=Polyplosphaeria fusca TaxID=682080 RepID=A0A9P4V3T1_9PLEO|nr:hypothetical protein EJ04DRAFT_194815 [Polyplosphaeria fusca]